MQPVPPSWFKGRQATMEAAGPDTFRLSAPQQQDAFISARPAGDGRWAAGLRLAAEGPEVAATGPDFDNVLDAWDAAFELYRNHVIT